MGGHEASQGENGQVKHIEETQVRVAVVVSCCLSYNSERREQLAANPLHTRPATHHTTHGYKHNTTTYTSADSNQQKGEE